MGTTPGRVLPGKKWQVSLKLQRFKLKVIQIDLEENI
jgi:hypothetical protein